jgi:mono/diheme cytochrome c family protein
MSRFPLRTPARSRAALAAAGLAALAYGGPVRAESGGQALFEQHCAACHGSSAKGDGPLAEELKKAPPDLTQLGKKYGMPLPKPKLIEFVDGREMVRSHGTAEMPVWGKALRGGIPPSAGSEAHTRGTIFVILEWLDTIQAK